MLSWCEEPTYVANAFYDVRALIDSHRATVSEFLREKLLFPPKVSREVSTYLQAEHDTKVLAQMYSIEKHSEVRDFLRSHQHLATTLTEAHQPITEVFGEDVRVRLEIHRDPEEGWEELFAIVETCLPPSDALDLLDRFDEEWWLRVDTQATRGLEVDVDAVP